PDAGFRGFAIRRSTPDQERRTWISPDTSVCPECLRELFDPEDRRYKYPFINCTHCGPRFTIVEGVPYDRDRTTMRAFEMCPSCRREYEDPADRRFHAQPNACPICGPKVWLVDGNGCKRDGNVFRSVGEKLRAGGIVAIKGLGGFHLACDALNEEAVQRLRGRKVREDKPFALMAEDGAMARELCRVSAEETQLLESQQRPIVLMKKRSGPGIAEAVAPGSPCLGVMLPYTPLHHVLLREVKRPLVMTSGNLSDEPISYENEEALSRLSGIADVFLLHDRPIHMRCDDSVVRVFQGRERTEGEPGSGGDEKMGFSVFPCLRGQGIAPTVLRRSRGYVPGPIPIPFAADRPILACGAELKNTFCLVRDEYAFVSHHIGDLENLETLRSFEEGIEHFKRLFDIEPEVIAHDLHPEYLSTKYARECYGADRGEVDPQSEIRNPQWDGTGAGRLVGVQHHHAHIASCLADNGLDRTVIGVAFDGTGYGTDGTIWGGEFLVADLANFERAAHLKLQGMPGGTMAIREPWRMAVSYLYGIFGEAFLNVDVPFVRGLDRRGLDVLMIALEKGINSPATSSMGRLFDAVSALIGVFRDRIHYEGQAAVELEQVAEEACADAYHFEIQEGIPLEINPEGVLRGIIEDLRNGASSGRISAKFHNAVAEMIASVCGLIRTRTGLKEVALSGGVFQNRMLLERTVPLLEKQGFSVYTHHQVPPNDGGISLGQAVVAMRKDA
ncbi:MAG: carbamoyltransferase HypF, partial [Candidatus Latescibacteria bacterium]|nr:carbamoyltransferase HypF [Candidatus Latescibacterota bacterium]